jgi:hypothetical protein
MGYDRNDFELNYGRTSKIGYGTNEPKAFISCEVGISGTFVCGDTSRGRSDNPGPQRPWCECTNSDALITSLPSCPPQIGNVKIRGQSYQ